MRRFDRLWEILRNESFTALGRLDALRIVWARRQRRKGFYPVRLSVGEVFVDAENATVDFQVLGQVLLDELYSELTIKESTVVDVGAHKGYFAAYALMAGAKAVFCYEPEPRNFSCLSRFAESARRHGKTVQTFQEAVADQEGEVTLYTSRESWSHTTMSCGQRYGAPLRVGSRSLSGILGEARAAFPKQDILLKIDAEGAECPLLLHTPASSFAPVKEIIFEYHAFSSCKLPDILSRTEILGYQYAASLKEPDMHLLRKVTPTQ